ncbi:MAG: hypothetical protein E7Z62_03070 [Thermoplasmata archaeon]|nr:hypothetical protein [Thermoplasmata archaeon]MBE6523917.1 hypothetical protein [Thermoplasmata archaeon]
MDWNSSLLEEKYALSILWIIRNNPNMTKTDIVRVDKGGEKTKYAMINKLIDAGLVSTYSDESMRWNTEYLILTEKGKTVAEHIEIINEAMKN